MINGRRAAFTWNLSSVSLSPIWRRRSPLAWPMLPAAVSTVCLGCRHTHTHRERKSSGCESAFGQNYIILYLDVDVVSSVICTVFYCEQHQCYLSELFKNTQKNDRILLHKYPKSLCLTRLWASSDLTRVYKARGLSRGETAHCIMQISSQQLYRTLTSE